MRRQLRIGLYLIAKKKKIDICLILLQWTRGYQEGRGEGEEEVWEGMVELESQKWTVETVSLFADSKMGRQPTRAPLALLTL